jgi:hypothetical protein
MTDLGNTFARAMAYTHAPWWHRRTIPSRRRLALEFLREAVQGEWSGEVPLMSEPMIEGGSRGLLRPADSVVIPGTAEC